MSRPRYTCMESTETSSTSPRARATWSASADFPEAVGPTIARCGQLTSAGTPSGWRRDDGDADARAARRRPGVDQVAAQPVRRRVRDAHASGTADGDVSPVTRA